jgi:TP901 family phage tail tape measure protein
MSDLNLAINVSAIDAASSVLRGIGSAISNLASGNVAGAAMAVGTAVVAVGAASTKMAADFQSGITSLSTGAGEAQSNLKMVGDGILGLAVQTGTSTKQLTDGMYMIESAGYHGAQGLDVLKNAAEGAKVGNADLGVVANGVTTIMTDFASQNINATQATNTLVATVASGKTTMQALSSSLSGVLPTASSAKVGLTDVMAAMATMTGEGVNANNATTYLRQTITTLSAPSKSVSDALKGIGLSAQQVSEGIKTSLPNTLDMITTALKKKFPEGSLAYNEALTKIAGGSKQMQGILDLTGQHMYTFQSNFSQIDKAVTGTGSTITGFSQVQGDFNFKMQQAQQAVNTLMIKLGSALLPVLGQVVGAVAPAITNFISWESKTHTLGNAFHTIGSAIGGLGAIIGNVVTFFKQHQDAMNVLRAALIVIAIQILSIVVPAFISFAVTAIGAAIGVLIAWFPLIAAFALVTAVVFGIIEVVQHWGDISKWLKGVWGAISSWFMSMLHDLGAFFVGVWNGIVAGLKAAWNFIIQVVRIGVLVMLAIIFAPIVLVAALFIWLYQHNTYFKMLVDAIVNFFKGCIAWIMSAWQAASAWLVGAWQAVVKFATDLWNQIAGAVQTAWNAAVGFVVGVWQKISSVFVSAWNTYIAGPLKAVWTNVSGVFSAAWNTYIAKPLNDIWNSVSKWFADLATGALNSGKNFVMMLVNGITSGAGALWNAVVNLAKNLWKALGFHSPAEEGPGADADEWMPNLISMMSRDLIAGVPKIQAAVNLVAKPLAVMGQPAHAGVSGPVAAPAASGGSGATVINNYINIDAPALSKREGKTLADEVLKHLDHAYRGSGNHITQTSGGKR